MLTSEPFEATLANTSQVILPKSVANLFLDRDQKRVRVRASNNNKEITFYAALIRNKNGSCTIYFSKAKQKELNIFMNDYFTLQLFEDTTKYGVDMPEELEAVLMSDHDAYTIFETLTPGRQRSIIYSIKRFKAIQTKVDKSLLLCENLKRGITDPKLWLKSH